MSSYGSLFTNLYAELQLYTMLSTAHMANRNIKMEMSDLKA